jgi:hypothetical protein
MRKTFNMLKRGGPVKQSLGISEEQLASINLQNKYQSSLNRCAYRIFPST